MFLMSNFDGQGRACQEKQGWAEQGERPGSGRVRGTAGPRTRGRLRVSSCSRGRGKAALGLPKMPLQTNPLRSQLNHSCVRGDGGRNTRERAKMSGFGNEITAAPLNSTPPGQNTSALHPDLLHTQWVSLAVICQRFRVYICLWKWVNAGKWGNSFQSYLKHHKLP